MRAEMDCPSSGYWTMGTLHVCGVRREEVTAWTSGDVRGRGYLGRVRLSGVGQAPGDKSLLPGSSPRWKGRPPQPNSERPQGSDLWAGLASRGPGFNG